MKPHRRSISAKISFALVLPWTCSRYFVTHSTKWSLKVPLINWCKISGASRRYMVAHGNPSVKGYKRWGLNMSVERVYTLMSASIPHSSHRAALENASLNASARSRERGAPPSSKLFGKAVHLSKPLVYTNQSNLNRPTVHTSFVLYKQVKLAQGNRRCKVQFHKWHGDDVHQDNEQLQLFPCWTWGTEAFVQVLHEIFSS